MMNEGDGYAVIKNGETAMMICNELTDAIKCVQSLESGLDRNTQHSPFTIVKADTLTCAQAEMVLMQKG